MIRIRSQGENSKLNSTFNSTFPIRKSGAWKIQFSENFIQVLELTLTVKGIEITHLQPTHIQIFH